MAMNTITILYIVIVFIAMNFLQCTRIDVDSVSQFIYYVLVSFSQDTSVVPIEAYCSDFHWTDL
jgi:hypothetical protein